MPPVWELQISLFAGDDVILELAVVWELSFPGLGALVASWANARWDRFVREGAERRGKKTEKSFK